MYIESNSESNYHWLASWLSDISEPFSYAGRDTHVSFAIRLSVLSRDEKFRPNRVTLSRLDTDPESFIEIHLYHDFSIAVALACMDSFGYRCAFDEQGVLISSRLSEFNELLEHWLRQSKRITLPDPVNFCASSFHG
ncbi:MAG: hypothetical protein ACR2RB_13440 [Gammaproteobacteria bacterium]